MTTATLLSYRPLVLAAIAIARAAETEAMNDGLVKTAILDEPVYINGILATLDTETPGGIGALTWSDLVAVVLDIDGNTRTTRARAGSFGLTSEVVRPTGCEMAAGALGDETLAEIVARSPDGEIEPEFETTEPCKLCHAEVVDLEAHLATCAENRLGRAYD